MDPDLSNQKECESGSIYPELMRFQISLIEMSADPDISIKNQRGSGSGSRRINVDPDLSNQNICGFEILHKKHLSMICSEIFEKMLQHFLSIFYFLLIFLSKSIQKTPTDARVYSIV